MKAKPKDGIHKLPSGLWSIPCQNCGKRHVQRHSDDYVWCKTCRDMCAESDHTPDSDEPTRCSVCGQPGLPIPEDEMFEDCPTCHGEGQILRVLPKRRR